MSVAYYILIGLFTGYFLISILSFFALRRNDLIKNRSLELTVASAIVCYVYYVFFSLIQIRLDKQLILNCELINWFYALFLPFWVTPYILRGELVVYEYWFNMGKLKQSQTLAYVLFRRRMSKRRYHFLIYFLLVIFWAVILVIVEYTSSPQSQDSVRNCLNNNIYVIAAQGIIFITAILLFIYALWKAKDTYAIRTELFILVCISIPIYIIFGVIFLVGDDVNQLKDFKSSYLLMILMFTSISISVVYPTILALFNRKVERKDGEEISTEELKTDEFFKATLDNSVLIESFEQFTVECWCTENIIFYKDVDKFRGLPEESINKEAKRIYEHFVKLGAELEINIDETTRQHVQTAINSDKISTSIFDEAQKVVYNQLRYDVFPKWIQSARFQVAFENSGVKRSETIDQLRSKRRIIKKKSKTNTIPDQTIGQELLENVS